MEPEILASRDPAPAWPERVALAARRLRDGEPGARTRLWTLLGLVLRVQTRSWSRRLGRVADADLEDVASQKALELMRRVEAGSLDLASMTPARVHGLLTATARNGIVDVLRRENVRDLGVEPHAPPAGPDDALARREFADAIVTCLASLTLRARTAWYLRAFWEWPSERIARHPAIASTPNAVEVMVHRARASIRACLARRGLDPAAMPPGTFVAVFESMRASGEGRDA